MDTRSLNRLVTIQHLPTGQDSFGQEQTQWSDFAQVWADVRHLSGIEAIKDGQETSVVNASIRIRYRRDISSGMQALTAGKTYRINAVLPDEETRRFVDLTCQLVGNV